MKNKVLLFGTVLLLFLVLVQGEFKLLKCKAYKQSEGYNVEKISQKKCQSPNHDDECSINNCENGCFTLFQKNDTTNNETNPEIYPIAKNCWHGDDPLCGNKTYSCKLSNTQSKTLYHCICCSDYCNNYSLTHEEIQFYLEPRKLVNDFKNEDRQQWSSKQIILLIVCVGAFLFLLTSLAIIITQCMRRKSLNSILNRMENSSIETPKSNETSSTPMLDMDRLSVNKLQFDFPQLAELKARGRFGCVWRAHRPGKDDVAVKIFLMQDKDSWMNEQGILGTNLVDNHPHILKMIAAATRNEGVEKELWLITEFHEKGSLTDYLRCNTMDLPTSLNFLRSMANGLAFLHEDVGPNSEMHGLHGAKPSIAHRDFKSKNVLVKSDMTACIADFGLAMKFVSGESTGESHGQVGTRRYMSPEVLEGAINFQRDAFLRIDIYAYALVAWEVLTRCHDVPGGATEKYLMPYELEFGAQPNSASLTEFVCDQKQRPRIKNMWLTNNIIADWVETINECWDNDAEARLASGCVEERFRQMLVRCQASGCQDNNSSENDDLIIQSSVNTSSQHVIDVAFQNLVNFKKNRQQQGCCEEQQKLI